MIGKQRQYLKFTNDPNCQYGSPDHANNFSTSSRKSAAANLPSPNNAPKHQAVSVDNGIIECIPNSHPEIVGKCARMEEEWYEGVVSS